MSAAQMAALLKMFPLFGKASDRLQKRAGKLAGTPLETTLTVESVKSKQDLEAAQKQRPAAAAAASAACSRRK
jgi:hypothetical protein